MLFRSAPKISPADGYGSPEVLRRLTQGAARSGQRGSFRRAVRRRPTDRLSSLQTSNLGLRARRAADGLHSSRGAPRASSLLCSGSRRCRVVRMTGRPNPKMSGWVSDQFTITFAASVANPWPQNCSAKIFRNQPGPVDPQFDIADRFAVPTATQRPWIGGTVFPATRATLHPKQLLSSLCIVPRPIGTGHLQLSGVIHVNARGVTHCDGPQRRRSVSIWWGGFKRS